MIDTKRDLICAPGSQPCKSRVVGIVGIAGSVTMLVGTLYALAVYPGYNILNQYISDLGRASDYSGAILFNASVMIGAAFLLLFGVMFSFSMSNKAAALLCMLSSTVAGIGVFLVGAIPSDVDWFLHRIVTSVAFVGLMASAALFAGAMLVQDRPHVQKILAMFLFVPLGCNIALLVMAGAAGLFDGSLFAEITTASGIYWLSILEWLSIYSFIAWILVISIHEMT